MRFNRPLFTLLMLISVPTNAVAYDEPDLVDAELEDTFEDFKSARSDRKSTQKVNAEDVQRDSLDEFDEDPDWDLPSESDEELGDEDPSWDEEPGLGGAFEDDFEEEEDFIIPQTAPKAVVELDEELPSVQKVEEANIANDKPGLDLSVFDIED